MSVPLLLCSIGLCAFSPQTFPALGKGVLAAAQFAEDVGDATDTAAKAGANITAAAAEVVVSLTTGFFTTFSRVDLLAVNLQVERSIVSVDDATEMADFIDSDKGGQWLPAPFELPHEVAEIIRELSPLTLRGSLTRVRLNASGSYLELKLSSGYLNTGYVGLGWNMIVRWATPLWGLRRSQIRVAASFLRDPRRGVRETSLYQDAVALHTRLLSRLCKLFSKLLAFFWQSMVEIFRAYE